MEISLLLLGDQSQTRHSSVLSNNQARQLVGAKKNALVGEDGGSGEKDNNVRNKTSPLCVFV